MSDTASTQSLLDVGEPRVTQWAALVLGVALLMAAGIVTLVLLIENGAGSLTDPGFWGFGGGMAFLGLVAGVFGARDLVTKPTWRVYPDRVVRVRSGKEAKTLRFADLPEPMLRKQVRYGNVVSVWVQFGRVILVAPDVESAQAIAGAWRKARG